MIRYRCSTTALVMLVGAAVGCERAAPATTPPEARFELPLPAGSRVAGFQISPDGRRLVVAVKNQLWVRSFDALEFTALPDTSGARDPFWSPDGTSIAFFADGALKRVSPARQGVVQVCSAQNAMGGTWSRDDVILFAAGRASRGIHRVAASGGDPVEVANLKGADPVAHLAFPEFLPDGRHFLYSRRHSPGAEDGGVFIGSLEGTAPVRLLPDETNVAFASGQLLFRRGGSLMTHAFDATAQRLSGEPRAVAKSIATTASGAGAFSGSEAGTLAYHVGGARLSELAWVDRTGRRVGAAGSPGPILSARLSPDGRRLAYVAGEGPLGDVWLLDLPTSESTRLTDAAATGRVAWSPRSDEIALDAADPTPRLLLRRVDGARTETPLPTTGAALRIGDWSGNGRWLAFEQEGKKTDVWLLAMLSRDLPLPAVGSDGVDGDAAFSPDSRLMAYVQDSGEGPDVHVRPFPQPGATFQVSRGGGTSPRWNRDGTELFFQSLDDRLMSVPVSLGTSFAAGEAHSLFEVGAGRFQDPAPDGKRFLILAPIDALQLTITHNWRPGP